MKKNLLRSFALSLFLLASSCSNLSDIDKPVCVEINLSKGYCTSIISGEGFVIDDENPYQGKTWWELRPTHIQVPHETWAAIKTYLITNCRRSRQCNRNIDSWTRSIEELEKTIEEKNRGGVSSAPIKIRLTGKLQSY